MPLFCFVEKIVHLKIVGKPEFLMIQGRVRRLDLESALDKWANEDFSFRTYAKCENSLSILP